MNESEEFFTRREGSAFPELIQLKPGTMVGRFQLVDRLGHGGMGQAWKAVDPTRRGDGEDGFVVLKFLPDELRLNPDATEEFQGEYRRVQKLHHQYICPLHDLGQHEGMGCFQVMDFLPGTTLRKVMKSEDPCDCGLPVDRVVDLLRPVAAALDYAHGRKLIHRDIKPENIMVDDATGDVHVIEVGLAAQVRSTISRYGQRQMSNSGTEAYKSPEQWHGKPQYPASDQWALAVVAWEMLTGKMPFLGDGMQLGFAVTQSELPKLPQSLSHLQSVFQQAMHKDHGDRFDLCTVLIEELQQPTAPTIIVPKKPQLLGFPASANEVKSIQQQWAEYLNLPVVSAHPCGDMVLIPPGEFLMGTSHSVDQMMKLFAKFEPKAEWFEHEGPQHKVTITRPFLVGQSAITLEAFSNFVTATGYVTEPESDGEGGWGYDPEAEGNKFVDRDPRFNWRKTGWEQTPQHPVVNITWNDVAKFVSHANSQAQSIGCNSYRLLREAEWEYCARAGTGAFYYNGNDPEEFHRIGNCIDGDWKKTFPNTKGASRAIVGKSGFAFAAPVGQFQTNAFGLHDMLGNVWEWCDDWYDEGYYGKSPEEDPCGPSSGSSCVLRGGSWNIYASCCRSACRDHSVPSNRDNRIGFRVLCELV